MKIDFYRGNRNWCLQVERRKELAHTLNQKLGPSLLDEYLLKACNLWESRVTLGAPDASRERPCFWMRPDNPYTSPISPRRLGRRFVEMSGEIGDSRAEPSSELVRALPPSGRPAALLLQKVPWPSPRAPLRSSLTFLGAHPPKHCADRIRLWRVSPVFEFDLLSLAWFLPGLLLKIWLKKTLNFSQYSTIEKLTSIFKCKLSLIGHCADTHKKEG